MNTRRAPRKLVPITPAIRQEILRNCASDFVAIKAALTKRPKVVARLREVRALILRYPNNLDMDNYRASKPEATTPNPHTCGTTMCIAGWYGAVRPGWRYIKADVDSNAWRNADHLPNNLQRGDELKSCSTLLCNDLFGADNDYLLDGDIDHLIGPADAWPLPFADAYADAPEGSRERARVTAERIDFFLATGA